jgi:hypothetical protein
LRGVKFHSNAVGNPTIADTTGASTQRHVTGVLDDKGKSIATNCTGTNDLPVKG